MSRMNVIFTLFLVAIFFLASFVLLNHPKYVTPYLYTFTSKLSFEQQDAKYVEDGVEINRFKVGDTPTSIDITYRDKRKLALVTSMGDSVVVVTDLSSIDGEPLSSYRFTSGAKPRVSIWCDIDNDGVEELVIPLWGEGFSSIFVGALNSDSTISKIGEYTVGYRPRSVACGDLDNDGYNEIVSADNFSDTISIIDNDGSLSYLKSIGVASEPGAIKITDFDGDGLRDLIVTHRASNNIYVLLNEKNLNFHISLVIPTMKAPKDQVVVDIDLDGFKDIITVDGATNNISIYYIKSMRVHEVERVKLSGSPHSLKYIPSTQASKKGTIVAAVYPNWVEVASFCADRYVLTESLWFADYYGLRKRKILYLDHISGEDNVYAVMAGIDSVVQLPIRLSECN